MIVRRIDPQTETQRAVLYGDNPSYCVIADLPSPAIKVGDEIEYEPYGVNFGWYVRNGTEEQNERKQNDRRRTREISRWLVCWTGRNNQ